MDSYDVCVVGGGPAGVITAITVARAGYSVAIIDKKARDKIGDKNCGDALDAKHVKQMEDWLNLSPPSIDNGEANDIVSKITIAAGSLSDSITAVESNGYVVDRLIYGQRLLQTAEENGVTILPSSTVIDIVVEDEQVTGVIYSNRQTGKNTLLANITVDASGYTAKIRKLIPNILSLGVDLDLPDKYTIATYREIIKFKDSNYIHPYMNEIIWLYDEDVDLPGYIWIFSKGQGKLNIGITWDKSLPYPDNKSLKELYHQFLDPYFDPSSYEILKKGGGNIPMRPNFDSLVFNGVILVGDAGCLVDPTTFEGHGPALESGKWAGDSCIEALEKRSFTHQDLWPYNVRIQNYLGRIHMQSYVTAKLLERVGVNNLKFMIKRGVLNEKDLVETFQEENATISTITKLKKLIYGFPRWGVLLKLALTLNKIEKLADIYLNYPTSPDGLHAWIDTRDTVIKLSP